MASIKHDISFKSAMIIINATSMPLSDLWKERLNRGAIYG